MIFNDNLEAKGELTLSLLLFIQDLSRTLPPSGVQSTHMHGRMMRYNAIIQSLNESRLLNIPYALISNLLTAAQSMTNASQDPVKSQPLLESYEALFHIVGEMPDGRNPIRQREFSNSYIDLNNWSGREGKELRKKFIKGSKKFLEIQFERFMDSTIEGSPSKAQLGGRPSIVNRIKGFLRCQLLTREGQWENDLEIVKPTDGTGAFPIWAAVFYLVRIGKTEDALELILENETGLGRLDQSFSTYFKAFNDSQDQKLPTNLRDRFFTDFNARFRSGTDGADPFKFALYKIIGRIDLSKKFPNALTRSTENWLWLQMSLVRESEDEEDGGRDHYSLEVLGKKLRGYGEAHFDPKGTRPLHYFQVLLLSAQFERVSGERELKGERKGERCDREEETDARFLDLLSCIRP